ncbi:MAG: patatin-like phospholipase family protein [Rhodospirillales bacterium]|nr:patatin-like phospholipase family protein [Rhodospirillales bacterium]MCB9996051.1 patatin-like phospholipase family protein [Rhodospirillales bacterium]
MLDPNKTLIALFNYGGGMRGLVPAHIMSRIEEATGLRMAEMVDIFSGPSTGAILNAALTRRHPEHTSRPLYKARHLVKFYEREGLKIFPPDSFRDFRGILHDFNNRTLKLSQMNWLLRHGHYDPANLGKALKALYGDSLLEESLSSLIIPTYNIDGEQLEVAEEKDETGDTPARTVNNFCDEGGHAVWLKHIKNDYPPGAAQRTPRVSLYDAVMASCAAPTYFPCHHFEATYPDQRGRMSYSAIDGVIFDNPCISYLGAIRRHIPKDYNLVMIILGTGYTNRSIKKEDWNRYGSLGVVDPVNDLPLINIFFHASESALLEGFEEEMGDNLFIFNKSMIPTLGHPDAASPQIDDASPDNLKKLQFFAEEIMEENNSKLDAVCHLLSHRRDRRSETSQRTLKSKMRRYYYLFTGERKNEKRHKSDS